MTDKYMTALPGGRKAALPEQIKYALLGSTAIPELGMTFAEAGARWHALKAEADQLFESNPEDTSAWDDLDAERDQITQAVLKASPQTARDAQVEMDILAHHVPTLLHTQHEIEVRAALRSVNSIFSAALAHFSRLSEVPSANLDAHQSSSADNDLLRAYADWVKASRIHDALPDDREDEAYEPYHRAVYEALERLHSIPATTPQGVAAKLRWLWMALGEGKDHHDAIIHGAPVTDDILDDWRFRLGWNLIAEVEALGNSAGPDLAAPQADAFADTVTGFTNEGTASLALPGAPTDAMVIAGAKAAGCSPEDLRRGYDAMVAAYAQERAA